jgi:pimeloyl-ACP methyl ester carboxylesterase
VEAGVRRHGRVHIVWGRYDSLFPLDRDGERLRRIFGSASLERIEGAGHVPQEEDPVALVEILDRIL